MFQTKSITTNQRGKVVDSWRSELPITLVFESIWFIGLEQPTGLLLVIVITNTPPLEQGKQKYIFIILPFL